MKSVLGFITAIVIVATSSPISKNLYHQVKVDSLKKVDQGLGSLSDFTEKLTTNELPMRW